MRILIDECLRHELADELVGHEVATVQEAGWAGLSNGELLKKVSGNFEVSLTIGKRIESEQKVPGDVALITIRAHSNRIQDLRPLLPELLRVMKETPAGKSARMGRITKPMSPPPRFGSAEGYGKANTLLPRLTWRSRRGLSPGRWCAKHSLALLAG